METSVRTGLSTFPVQWKVTIVPAFRKLSSMALQQHRLGQVSKHLAHISPLVKHVETPAHRFKNLAKALIRTLRHWNTVPVARLTRTLRTHSIDTPLRRGVRNKIDLRFRIYVSEFTFQFLQSYWTVLLVAHETDLLR